MLNNIWFAVFLLWSSTFLKPIETNLQNDPSEPISIYQNQQKVKINLLIPGFVMNDGGIGVKKEDAFYPEKTFVILNKNRLNKITEIRLESEFLEDSPWILPITGFEAVKSEKSISEFFYSDNGKNFIVVELDRKNNIFVFHYDYNEYKKAHSSVLLCYYKNDKN